MTHVGIRYTFFVRSDELGLSQTIILFIISIYTYILLLEYYFCLCFCLLLLHISLCLYFDSLRICTPNGWMTGQGSWLNVYTNSLLLRTQHFEITVLECLLFFRFYSLILFIMMKWSILLLFGVRFKMMFLYDVLEITLGLLGMFWKIIKYWDIMFW